MPLQGSDIKTYKSLAADSDGQGIDTSREITTGVDNNLFPDITAAEALSGVTKYRKYFKKNTSGSDAWNAVQSWIKQQPNADAISVGVGIDHTDDREGDQGNMVAFTADAKVVVVSDGADTRTVTVTFEDTAGNKTVENLVLNGAVEVLSAATCETGRNYQAYVSAEDGTRTVSIKQGAGGTVRGTIAPNRKISFLWRTGTDIDTMAEGFKHGNVAAGGNYALWLKLVVPAGRAGATGVSFIIGNQGT